MFNVAVIGLGVVGLTLAVALAKAGQQVYGIEKSRRITSGLKQGKTCIHEPGLAEILKIHLGKNLTVFSPDTINVGVKLDVIVIAVGTYLDTEHGEEVDFSHLESALETTVRLMNTGHTTIVLRSTLPIGATAKIKRKLEESLGCDCAVAYCPERICEGVAMEELRTLPQIAAASDPAAQARVSELFALLGEEIVQCESLEEAEAVKLFCNTYRDLNFGIGNLFYRVADRYGLNGISVINKANYAYPRSSIPVPGPVGGSCLIKDPIILASTLDDPDLSHFLHLGRFQTKALEDKIKTYLRSKIAAASGRVLISGLAFKGAPETSDLRHSAGVEMARDALEQFGADRIDVHDFVAFADEVKAALSVENVSLEELTARDRSYEAIVVLNNHPKYSSSEFHAFVDENLEPGGWVFDCWSQLDADRVVRSGRLYFSLENMG